MPPAAIKPGAAECAGQACDSGGKASPGCSSASFGRWFMGWASGDVDVVHAELAQPPLDVLVQLLPADATERLQEAIDTFDFEQAVVQLQQLRKHWLD